MNQVYCLISILSAIKWDCRSFVNLASHVYQPDKELKIQISGCPKSRVSSLSSNNTSVLFYEETFEILQANYTITIISMRVASFFLSKGF